MCSVMNMMMYISWSRRCVCCMHCTISLLFSTLFRRNILKAIHIQYSKNSVHQLSRHDLGHLFWRRYFWKTTPRDNHVTGQTHVRKSNCGQSQTTYAPWSRKSRYLRIINIIGHVCMCVISDAVQHARVQPGFADRYLILGLH